MSDNDPGLLKLVSNLTPNIISSVIEKLAVKIAKDTPVEDLFKMAGFIEQSFRDELDRVLGESINIALKSHKVFSNTAVKDEFFKPAIVNEAKRIILKGETPTANDVNEAIASIITLDDRLPEQLRQIKLNYQVDVQEEISGLITSFFQIFWRLISEHQILDGMLTRKQIKESEEAVIDEIGESTNALGEKIDRVQDNINALSPPIPTQTNEGGGNNFIVNGQSHTVAGGHIIYNYPTSPPQKDNSADTLTAHIQNGNAHIAKSLAEDRLNSNPHDYEAMFFLALIPLTYKSAYKIDRSQIRVMLRQLYSVSESESRWSMTASVIKCIIEHEHFRKQVYRKDRQKIVEERKQIDLRLLTLLETGTDILRELGLHS